MVTFLVIQFIVLIVGELRLEQHNMTHAMFAMEMGEFLFLFVFIFDSFDVEFNF